MTDIDYARLREMAEKATRGPWRWTDRRVPDLVGRGGDPDVYEYEIEVIDAEHYGECGCRSACELNLNVGPFDAEFIAAADPQTVLALLDEIKRLRSEVGVHEEELIERDREIEELSEALSIWENGG